jgi:hypothetical protein
MIFNISPGESSQPVIGCITVLVRARIMRTRQQQAAMTARLGDNPKAMA